MSSPLLAKLNEKQKEAVVHKEGPLFIIAGAGTGKTTVLTHRIAYLIEQKVVKPENILALTFTDKAATEMEERVDKLVEYGYMDMSISTFHAFCESLLRTYGAEMGLSRQFRMLTELEAWLLTREKFERFELDYFRPLGNPTKYIRSLLTHFSRLKDEAITPDAYDTFVENMSANTDVTLSEAVSLEIKKYKELAQAYRTYQAILAEQDALDFGDLILSTLQLLQKRPNVLERIRATYQYVLVDEFQDTNTAQYAIVKLISAPKNNLTVVGDDDQAIYRFRGGSVAHMLRFAEDYPTAKQVVLTDNYRSTQLILDAAHAFIQKNNPDRLEATDPNLSKKLVSFSPVTGHIEHLHCPNAEEEHERVAQKILALKVEHPDANWSDFAILARSNDSAASFLPALERHQIPFHFVALSGLYVKPVVMDLVSLLQIVEHPFDGPHMYRLLSWPQWKLDPHVVIELLHTASRKAKPLIEIMKSARAFLSQHESHVVETIEHITSLVTRLQMEARKQPADRFFLYAVRESGYLAHLQSLPEQQQQEAFGYLQQFYDRIRQFMGLHTGAHLRAFLDQFKQELEAGEEGTLGLDLQAGPDVVKVMTTHASKGLEFRFVFVVHVVDRRFPAQARAEAIPLPSGLATETEEAANAHLQEERRLFYVALTRAKEYVCLTSAETYGESKKKKPSRFLLEMGFDPEVLKLDAGFTTAVTDGATPPSLSTKPVIYPIPKQFSFTQLAAFRTCPLQYKFAHLLKIPVSGKWSFSYGQTMHNTLHAFFTLWMERVGMKQASLFEAPKVITTKEGLPVSLAELMAFYDQYWQDDWFADASQKEKYREQGRDSLKNYFASLLTTPANPLFLERGFTMKWGDVILKGRIDRMDTYEDGAEIIDYKTGTPKEGGKLEKEDKEQLMLYQLAARDVFRVTPKKLTYHYLNDNSRVSFLAKDEELAELQETIIERVHNLRKSNFDATPGFACRYCDFADICPFRER